ncbi:hypothetical protein T01_3702, partial [Trichinella spiralis]
LNSELQIRCLTFKRTSRWIILPDIATSMRYEMSSILLLLTLRRIFPYDSSYRTV